MRQSLLQKRKGVTVQTPVQNSEAVITPEENSKALISPDSGATVKQLSLQYSIAEVTPEQLSRNQARAACREKLKTFANYDNEIDKNKSMKLSRMGSMHSE